jgi:hypothetical protein
LISSEINVTPAGVLIWAQDVFGNAVATVTFSAMTDALTIDLATDEASEASVQLTQSIFDVEHRCQRMEQPVSLGGSCRSAFATMGPDQRRFLV